MKNFYCYNCSINLHSVKKECCFGGAFLCYKYYHYIFHTAPDDLAVIVAVKDFQPFSIKC